MSRSNPNDNGAANPAVRWMEWSGDKGNLKYYDKAKEEKASVDLPFTFIYLDQLSSVRGWDDVSESGIYSNEVRDTSQDVLVVRSFKGGAVAEGLYRDIKDRVNNAGAKFTANIYIAFEHNDGPAIGSLRLKGAALFAWSEFKKANRGKLYEQAIEIYTFADGKNGGVKFRTPVFRMVPLDSKSNDIAVGLDAELQAFLKGYLSKPKKEQVDHTATEAPEFDEREYEEIPVGD